MKRLLALVGVLAAALVASALPAFGADSGTIAMSVTAAAPCLSISVPSVNFGTVPFNTAGSQKSTPSSTSPSFTNCGSAAEQVFVRGTDASNSAGATWSLGGVNCGGGTVDVFDVQYAGALLSEVDKQVLAAFQPGQIETDPVLLTMPCTGSSGAGTQMSWSVILTAAF